MRARSHAVLAVAACALGVALGAAVACSSDSFSGGGDDASTDGTAGDDARGDDARPPEGGDDAAADGGLFDATHLCDFVRHDFCIDFDTQAIDPSLADYAANDAAALAVDPGGCGSPFSGVARTFVPGTWAQVAKIFSGAYRNVDLALDLHVDDGGLGARIDVAGWKMYGALDDTYSVYFEIVGGELHVHAQTGQPDGGSSRDDVTVTSVPLAAPWIHLELSIAFAFGSTAASATTATWTVHVDGVQPVKGTGTFTTPFVPGASPSTVCSAGVFYSPDVPNTVHFDNFTADLAR